MNDGLLAMYHRLPAPARSAAATLRGWYLRHWRYGPQSGRLVHEALERDAWTAARWASWTEDRLALLLHRAAMRVPYYRDYWARRQRRGNAPWARLENWPVLEKDVVREDPRRFVADDCDVRRMFHEQTSGTTGKALEIWRSRRTVIELQALADARTELWHGVPKGARWARLGGQLVTPIQQRQPPFWVWNAAMRQLYMSSFHLAPDLIPHYLDALARHRIVYLAAYPSSLTVLAHGVLESGRRDLRMHAVFTNAEPLSAEQRAIIGEAFQCPVRETYGMCEAVAAASECTDGGLHLWPEVGIVEVFDGEVPARPGSSGDFVCTGLLNPDMPLVRYRVGDRGRLAPGDAKCPCGRPLPLIAAVEGRTNDLLLTRDGRQVFWLNPVFYGLPVRQSQIEQTSLDQLVVRLAPAPGWDEAATRTVLERLHARMGDVAVDLRLVDHVPRTSNGKIQAIVCRLSADERRRALGAAPAQGEAATV